MQPISDIWQTCFSYRLYFMGNLNTLYVLNLNEPEI